MEAQSNRSNRRESAISSLNAAIDALNIVKEAMDPTPVKAALGAVSALLTMIRVGSLPVHVGRLLANVHRTP